MTAIAAAVAAILALIGAALWKGRKIERDAARLKDAEDKEATQKRISDALSDRRHWLDRLRSDK